MQPAECVTIKRAIAIKLTAGIHSYLPTGKQFSVAFVVYHATIQLLPSI